MIQALLRISIFSAALMILETNTMSLSQVLSSAQTNKSPTNDLLIDNNLSELQNLLQTWNETEPYDAPSSYGETSLDTLESVIGFILRHVDSDVGSDLLPEGPNPIEITENQVGVPFQPAEKSRQMYSEQDENIEKRNPEGELLKILRNLRRRNRAKTLSFEILQSLHRQLLGF